MDSKTETVSDNCLISDFMGGFNYNQQTRHIGVNLPFRLNEWSDYKDMQYQTSWDWLMPVVDKIESLDYEVDVYKHACEINTEDMIRFEALSKIEATYKAVVEFIRWFNSQSPDTIK